MKRPASPAWTTGAATNIAATPAFWRRRKQEYPRIALRARREKAVIYWSDETGVNNQDQIGKGYAPQGVTPVLHQTARKFSASMIAAVSNRGLMRFMIYRAALNVDTFVGF